ncbi:CubicO group peptidase, beta-lactamase class C family [Cognatiyoonia koreensis]|uniref:CubicO group peptidase, beta-lactamase class C family n=1 Tax=Cognatiyoonia koreensis TaxID=364200 RepID=A0A1I0MI28_9RHOB|nr:serine hydrolase domain-containing protein [Cognatiyoonia koreensis]SEV87985.1 CubicO group peptidase, beta-lactamase class C family [Cognatiyoonia koreensis]
MTLSQDLQALIDAECAKAFTHGLILRVASGDGAVDFKGGSGAAVSDTRFPIASISKMFTAALIMQLTDDGRIRLDQSVQSILADTDMSGLHVVKGVDHSPLLTVRQLLHQTSGLADYYESDLAADLKKGNDRSYDLNDVLQMTQALPPQAAPESGRSYYSDTNYQLLGAVIEYATGLTYDQALQSRICEPLGLNDTQVLQGTDFGLPVYHRDALLNVPQILTSMGPDGGIISTLDEMLIFLRAFMQGQLFKQENTAQMRQWNRLFFPLQYGYGLMRIKLPRWMTLFRATPEMIGHSGASGSFAFHAPEPDIYLIGTFNQTDASRRPIKLMLRVLDLVAKDRGSR